MYGHHAFKMLGKDEFQLRWLNLKRIDVAIPILITLISNHLIWNSSQFILGRKIIFSPLYIVFSKLTLNKVILKWYSRVTFFENHLTFTLRQQIKALHNFKCPKFIVGSDSPFDPPEVGRQ